MKTRLAVAAAFVVMSGVGVLVAQEPGVGQNPQDGSTPAYAMQVNSRLVVLDVVVLDAKGGTLCPGWMLRSFM